MRFLVITHLVLTALILHGQSENVATEAIDKYTFSTRDERLADWQTDQYRLLLPNAPVPTDYDHDDYHWYGIYDDDGSISVWPVECVYKEQDVDCVPGLYIYTAQGDQPIYFVGTKELLPEHFPKRVRQASQMSMAEFMRFQYGPSASYSGSSSFTRQSGNRIVVDLLSRELVMDIDLDGIEDEIASYVVCCSNCTKAYVLWLSSISEPDRVFKAASYFLVPPDCQ
ncbi:MAG: hypothetical protein AAF741_02965 [Bacteroidota bacterium]